MVREPVVAGQFYPNEPGRLIRQIEECLDKKQPEKQSAKACLMPHAGYVYSGAVAVAVASSIKLPECFIILGPNHTGLGPPLSIMTEGTWKTPLAEIPIHNELAQTICQLCPHIKKDLLAHTEEHSIEVELPILKYFRKDAFSFVPIVVSIAKPELYTQLGKTIAQAVEKLQLESQVLVIASSDMTHYETDEMARKKDDMAIQALLKLDEVELLKVVSGHDISMCGAAPAAVMLAAAKTLGAHQARLVKYQTSAEASGDYQAVVGYAGIIFS